MSVVITGGPPIAAPMSLNKQPPESSSLFQIASSIKGRLEEVPGISPFLNMCISGITSTPQQESITSPISTTSSTTISPQNYSSHPTSNINRDSTDSQSSITLKESNSSIALSHSTNHTSSIFYPLGKRIDPVTHLWHFFRFGFSLCALFNTLNPQTPLKVNVTEDIKICKRSVYDFVQACKSELDYSDDELFTISNVYSDNTTDLIKVIRTVVLLLDTLESRNIIPRATKQLPSLPVPKDKRDKVVEEILMTERKYVHDLEVLLGFQSELQSSGVLSADTIHNLFPTLNNLIDFQRRFLIGIEYHAQLPPQEQFIGVVFSNFASGFKVYESFANSQKKASDIAITESAKLASLSHMVDPTYELHCYLIKPIQRICKYPLLLRELIKYTPENWPAYSDLITALDAMKGIAHNVNETQRRVDNISIANDLRERLVDWKGHDMDGFGALLYDGVFPVIKTGAERTYHLYLFEKIILCCKEAVQSKKSMTLTTKKTKVAKPNNFILKGRIYITFINEVSSSTKGGYLLHLSWGSDSSDTGSFDIKFRNDEQLDQWQSTITSLVADLNGSTPVKEVQNPLSNAAPKVNGTDYYEGSDDESYDLPQYHSNGSSTNHSREAFQEEDQVTHNVGVSSHLSYPIDSSSLDKYSYQQQVSTLAEELDGLRVNQGPYGSANSYGNLNGNGFNHPHHTVKRKDSAISESSIYTSMQSNNNPYNMRTRSASVPTTIQAYNTNGNFAAPPVPALHEGYTEDNLSTTIRNSNLTEIPPPNGYIRHTIINEEKSITEDSSGGSSFASSSTTGMSTATMTTSGTNMSSTNLSALNKKPVQMKVRLHYLEDTFLLIVPVNVSYAMLLERVERKIRLCGKQTPVPLRIKYKDEDDDFVTMHSDEDIQMALENYEDYDYDDDDNTNTTHSTANDNKKPVPDLAIWAA